MLALLQSPENWIAFATLTLLETVLGIDNVVFPWILVSRLPASRQRSARILGLLLAMLTRLALLFSVVWLTRLTTPLFSVLQRSISGRDLILGAGGLFLLGKSATEIHNTLDGAATPQPASILAAFHMVVIPIALIGVGFSLDSVFTAVGVGRPGQLPIMVEAIWLWVVVMMWLSGPIGAFVA